MKKIVKFLTYMTLVCAIFVSSAFATPMPVYGAAAKEKVKGLTVGDTKISGFKEIQGVVEFGSEIVVYGINKSGVNIYTYSTNGKTFAKNKKTGMDGTLVYYAAGTRLYVISKDKYGTILSYKSVTSASKLYKAENIVFKDTLVPMIEMKDPQDKFSLTNGTFKVNEENGTLINTLSFEDYLYTDDYSYEDVYDEVEQVIVLNGNEIIQLSMGEDAIGDTEPVGLANGLYINEQADGFEMVLRVSISSENEQLFYTTDGINYTKMPIDPHKDNSWEASYHWVNNQFISLRNNRYPKYSLRKAKDGKSYYYIYSLEQNKWNLQKVNVKNDTAFRVGGKNNRSTYYDANADVYYPVLHYKVTKGDQILYTEDGTTWNTLPYLTDATAEKKNYRHNEVKYIKMGDTTYAISDYYKGTADNTYAIVYRLEGDTWKQLFKKSYWTSTFTDVVLFQETPYFLVKSGEKCVGYNLLTGKAYRLSFDLDYWCTTNIDGVNVIRSGKYLYTTKNGCKTMKKLVMKLNGKKVEKTIRNVCEVNATGKSYTYIVTKNKIYYKTTSLFIKAAK